MSNESKEIQVIEGDGSELIISPVHDHINNIQQPRKKQIEGIVIPEVKKKNNEKKNENAENSEKNENNNEENIENNEEENEKNNKQ